MARLVTQASSKATYLCGLSGSVVVSVITYAQEVSEPVPAVVDTAMCGGFFGFSDLLKPSNSLTLRPSWATETRAPLQASWLEPPPIEMKLSHSFCWYRPTASMTL